jgi:glycosyltransferase 2 family protein
MTEPPASSSPDHKPSRRGWLMFILRWGIALVGGWYILSNLSWNDYVMVADGAGLPVKVQLVKEQEGNDAAFTVWWRDPQGQWMERTVDRSQLITRPDYEKITIKDAATGAPVELHALGRRVKTDQPQERWPLVAIPPRGLWERYWNTYPPGTAAREVEIRDIVTPTAAGLQYPVIEEGLKRRVMHANAWLLVGAMAIFPFVFLLTTYRWWMLMRMVHIRMTLRRTFTINMVGNFYNSFLLGSTGGDVIKAIYAARNTTHRTRAVVSVMVDRVIGLYALIILAGAVAGSMWLATRGDIEHAAVTLRCRQVFVVSSGILACTAVGLAIYYSRLRQWLGIDWIMARLPMQKHVKKVRETMDLYGKHPWAVLGTVLITLPVHSIVVVSTSLACIAFGLPLEWWYYWVVVPITVLSAAIPISPQGAGVMEFVAYVLMRSQGATVTDVVALTMSIRIIQILWNITGGIFVIRGGFGQINDAQRELEEDLQRDEPEPGEAAEPGVTASPSA